MDPIEGENTEKNEQFFIYPEQAESLGIERSISAAERDKIDSSDFAGPHQSFPINSQEHLDAAAKLIGHADDPAAVKARAIAIAKRKGLKLPDNWQEEGKEDDKEERLQVPEHPFIYAPITRIDNEKWEVEGIATSEAVDSYGTVFSYEASKKAFQKWIERTANVREMHDKKAVGKGIGVQFDDANKQVIVRSRVSRGARDTWTKIQEGVLSGYSVGAGGNHKWGRIERNGKSYPYLTEYDLAELSYVDNASNPDGHGLTICRADGVNEEIVDITEPEPETTPVERTQEPEAIATPEEERAGARLSGDSKEKLHGMRDAAIQLCACDECQGMAGGDEPDGDEAAQERMQAVMTPALERSLSPIFQRHNAILARYAQFDTHYAEIQTSLDEIKKLQERFTQLDEIKATVERMANASTLDEVRASLETVKDRVEQIAKQPMPGGPIQNGARPPYEKTNPYQPEIPMTSRSQIEHETVQRLHAQGAFQTQDDQIAAAALMLQPMHGMRK